MKPNALQSALKVLATAMRGGSSEEPKPIDIAALGKELVANESLTAKQYEQIMAMDDEQKGMVSLLLEAATLKAKKAAAEEEETEEPPMETAEQKAAKAAAAAAAAPVVNKDQSKALEAFMANVTEQLKKLGDEVTGLKTNQGKVVSETIKRQGLIAALVANAAVGLDAADLEAMSTDVLAKLESKFRPADYSGQGHFASNANMDAGGDQTGADAPLVINQAAYMLAKPQKKAA